MDSVAGVLIAAVDINLPDPGAASRFAGLLLRDILLIIGVAVGVFLILAGFVKMSRRRRRRVRGGEKVYRPSLRAHDPEDEDVEDDDAAESDAGEIERRRYKRRQRRRGHRGRNPSLAETGGLPPARSEPRPGGPLNG